MGQRRRGPVNLGITAAILRRKRRTFEIEQLSQALVLECEDALDDDDGRSVQVLRLWQTLVGHK